MTPEQFHLFAAPLPEPMLLLTGSGLLLAGNRAVEKRLGYPPSDLVGKNLADVVADPSEEVAHYLRSCSRSRSLVLGSLQIAGQGGGVSCRAEGALMRPHEAGREAILMLRLTHKGSAVGRFVALNQRIEELGKEVQRRKLAEEEARQLGEKLRVTLYGIGDAVITTDLEGRVTMMNPVAEGLTGWTQDEAVGQPLMAVFNIVNETSREVVESPSCRALREGVIVGLANHTLLISKDGTERPIADSAAPIRDKNGNVVGVVLVFRDYSERRDAERALQEKEKLLAESQRISHVGSWVFSRSGEITWSDETYRIYGLLPGTTAPTSEEFLRLIHPEDRQAMQAWITACLAGEQPKDLEFRCLRPDGTIRFLNGRGELAQEAVTGLSLLTGTVQDVTERKQVEATLRATEQQFRLWIDGVKDHAIFLLDGDGNIATWNTGAQRIYGYTAEEILGRHRSQFFTVADIAKGEPQRELEEAIRRGQFAEEGWRVRKGGSLFWANGSITPIYDDHQQLQGFVKIARDLTERKRAEEAIRKAEESLRLKDRAIQAVSQGILITDPTLSDNPIIFASPGFEAMTGYSSTEIVGRNCRFLWGTDTDPATVRTIREAIQNGRECSVEILNYRKDGSKFWNALFMTPVRNDEGKLTNFVGVQADVTERRKLEQTISHSQKMETVGQLAGGIAHDFNNLLTVILGDCEFLERDATLTKENMELAKEIHRTADQAASLTRQLLAFSRKQILKPKVLDLNKVIVECGRMLGRLLGEDVALKTHLTSRLRPVRLDAGQFEQVLVNLAVNARDAMPHGGNLIIETANIELEGRMLASQPDLKPGPHVTVTVRDSGQGMSEGTLARLFEPFFTTKPLGKGTGLGLATVFGIIKQSGGQITVSSEVGVGSTFTLFFPQAQEASTEVPQSVVKPRSAQGTETILVVEDDENVRKLTCRILRSHGYHVLEAGNGTEALEVIIRPATHIQLVLTDVVMPEMNGRQLAEQLAKNYPEVKVLFLSGYTDDTILRQGVSMHETAFIQKPFSQGALAQKVRELLDG